MFVKVGILLLQNLYLLLYHRLNRQNDIPSWNKWRHFLYF